MKHEFLQELSIDKSDWKSVRLGDVVFEPKESVKDLIAAGIKHVVGLEHIDSKDIHLRRSAGIEEETTFTKKFSTGDVLFGRRRAYLKKAAKASFDGVCSGDIIVMRAKVGLLLPELLPFLVNSDTFFDYAVQHSAGGLSPRVKYKDLANYEFLLPPKEQQVDIAELLWAMDKLLEKELGVYRKIQHLEDTVIERLLSQERELKKSVDGVRFIKPTEGFLSSWASVLLGDICTKVTDGEHLSPTFVDAGYPLISAKDIGHNNVELSNAKYLTEEAFTLSRKRCDPDFNDVLIVSRGATIGRTTVNKNATPFALMGSVILLKPNDKVTGDFLGLCVKRRKYQRRLLAISGSTAQQAIYLVDIKKSKLDIPPLAYQQDVVELVSDLKSGRKKVGQQINISQTLLKSLINQVF